MLRLSRYNILSAKYLAQNFKEVQQNMRYIVISLCLGPYHRPFYDAHMEGEREPSKMTVNCGWLWMVQKGGGYSTKMWTSTLLHLSSTKMSSVRYRYAGFAFCHRFVIR